MESELTIAVHDLESRMAPLVGGSEGIDKIVEDTRTCSFLNTDKYGLLRFYHKSFLEYFAACKLYRSALTDHIELARNLRLTELSEEVMFFFAELWESEEDSPDHMVVRLEAVVEDLREEWSAVSAISAGSPPEQVLRTLEEDGIFRAVNNALRLCTYTPAGLSNLDVQGLPLVGTNLPWGTALPGKALDRQYAFQSHIPGAILRGCHGERMTWIDVRAIKLDAEGVRIANSVLSGCDFARGNLSAGSLIDSSFRDFNLGGAELEQLTAIGCYFENVTFLGASLSGARFVECEFQRCDLRQLAVDEARWERVTFRSCYSERREFRNSTLD